MAARRLPRKVYTGVYLTFLDKPNVSSCLKRKNLLRNYSAVRPYGEIRCGFVMAGVRRTRIDSCLTGNASGAWSKVWQANLTSGAGSRQCWDCEADLSNDSEFCTVCKSLQPLDQSLNYFNILGIQMVFNVDTKALTRVFRQLQAKFHPDRYTLKSEREQQFALEHSSAVNKAYRCLLHPVERALYLLDLSGRPLHEGQLDIDQEFLMAIMEVNEELAEANDKETVQSIGRRNTEILEALLREADAAFSSNDLEKARNVVAKIKYYNNIYEKVRSFEREHGIVD